MRTCTLLLICCIFAACKPNEQDTPDPVVPPPVKYVAAYQELQLSRTMDIDASHDTTFRYFGGAVFQTAMYQGSRYDVGELRYNDVVLTGSFIYYWPDSALSIPATGTWHIGGNTNYDAVSYNDNMPWPVLNNLPDTIHLGSPLTISLSNTHFVYAYIFKNKIPEQPLNGAQSYAGSVTFTFDYIPDYHDSAYIQISAYNMTDSSAVPVFYKNCRWSKWVKTVYP